MHILVFGAAGMVGRKLTERLAGRAGSVSARSPATLHDVVEPDPPAGAPFEVRTV